MSKHPWLSHILSAKSSFLHAAKLSYMTMYLHLAVGLGGIKKFDPAVDKQYNFVAWRKFDPAISRAQPPACKWDLVDLLTWLSTRTIISRARVVDLP